jgi:hypothetical protein
MSPVAWACVPETTHINVLFPTEGHPTNPTLATPVFATSKPIPGPPPLDLGSISSLRSFASLAERFYGHDQRHYSLPTPATYRHTLQLTQMVRSGLILLGLSHLILDGGDLRYCRRHFG